MRVIGVPAGSEATVLVTGPRRYRKHLHSSTTLRRLATGRYVVTARTLTTPATRLSRAVARVTTRRGASVTVTYPSDSPSLPTAPGTWTETEWCGTREPLDDLRAAYTPDRLLDTVLAVAHRRYPPAVDVITSMSATEIAGYSNGQDATFDDALMAFQILVHEGGHEWDMRHSTYNSVTYRIVDNATAVRAAATDTFPLSEILTRHPDPGSDTYADIYLAGRSGTQGFDMLLEEFVQYVHSLVAAACTDPAYPTSDRDGVLVFMWYVETYLAIARDQHPDDYREIVNANGLVEAILATWARAEYWLAHTEQTLIGLDDIAWSQRVYDPGNLASITRLRNQ